MATGVASWSKTAATNATADSTVNWAEGMAPSAVNDSSRAEMASVAKWRDDISGTVTTGGSATAFTITTNQVFATAAAMSGAMLCFIPHATSGAAPTLAVDGLTARAINISTGVAVPTGALILGTPYLVTYIHASTEFILQGALIGDTLQAISTDAGAGVAPTLDLYRNSASPAASDFIGSVDFNGKDSGAAKQLYARITAQITDATAASEDAILLLQQAIAGTLTTILSTSATALLTNLDFAVNTNKFTIASASGNTVAAGTIDGTSITASAALSGATAAGAMLASQAEQETSTATNKLVAPGTQQFHPSAAKMWGFVSGAGTPTLQVSYNITSITDTATGRMVVTIATDFSSANWSIVLAYQGATTAVIIMHISDSTLAAGSVEISYCNTAGTLTDPNSVFWAGFGDQ